MKWNKTTSIKVGIGAVAFLNIINFVAPVSLGTIMSEASSPTVSLANVSFSRGDLERFPMMGIGCAEVDGNQDGEADASLSEFYDDSMEGEFGSIEGYLHQYCIDEDYDGLDPAGPLLVPYVIRYEVRPSRLPAGWGWCQDEVAWASFEEQTEVGLVPAATPNDLKSLGYPSFWGDGGPAGSNGYYSIVGGYTEPNNTNRVTITPKILVCGPDSSTTSGIGWKYLVGKSMTLPVIGKWPRSN